MTRIPNIETLLASDDTNSAIIEIDTFIGELCDYGENLDKLTAPQKLFYINQNLEREVNNGGFNQYFINSSGDFAHETLESLKTIGAQITASLLQKAIDQFPGGKVPKDRDERVTQVEEIEEKANLVWEELDSKFFEYANDLNALNISYVRANSSQF